MAGNTWLVILFVITFNNVKEMIQGLDIAFYISLGERPFQKVLVRTMSIREKHVSRSLILGDYHSFVSKNLENIKIKLAGELKHLLHIGS